MKEISIEDVFKLKEKFDKYLTTAEQHEIIILAIIDLKLNNTIKTIQSNNNEIKDQKEARAMFRTILKVMGKDYSEYEEK